MSKLLMKSLKADLPALAELIRSQGRGKDTVLAHITPKEAALLKRRGGSGATNPATGLPEFQEDFDIGFGPGVYTPEVQPADISGADFTPQQIQDYGYTTPQDIMAGGYGGGFTPAEGVAADQFQLPSYDVEAQPGGFYGGRAPTASEFALTQPSVTRGLTEPGVVTPPGVEKAWYEKLRIIT